jgi:phosphate transport system substrate-binding protein
MNKVKISFLILLFAAAICTNCSKEEDRESMIIEGLTLKNFPVMDGSTSTDPLVRLVACKLFGYKYKWEQEGDNVTWSLSTGLSKKFVEQHLKCSQTHNAFINLINNEADMILSARTMSSDEKAYAIEAGISLIETPIALDALVFINNSTNPVQSLTHEQLQDIYTGRIKNWQELGWYDMLITPYVRNKNSGSQELMETMVMTDPITDAALDYYYNENHVISGMAPVFSEVSLNNGGIGYTIYYYKENIVRNWWGVNTLAINGVIPNKETIKDREYPFTAEVYVIIRSDLDKSSMAYKIYEFLQTPSGKDMINESGYVAN